MKENKLIETGVGPFLKKIEKRVIKRNKELLKERWRKRKRVDITLSMRGSKT